MAVLLDKFVAFMMQLLIPFRYQHGDFRVVQIFVYP